MAKEDPRAIKAKPELNLEEIARLELGETPETKAESLLRLRQLLEGTFMYSSLIPNYFFQVSDH